MIAQVKDPVIIQKLKAILEKNLENENFGVMELAREIGLSRSSLHRKIHAYNGNSTSQFIREFRLQKAMEILQDEEMTVSEIAYCVGFSSPTYFNTCFKEYYGYTPGEAKQKNTSIPSGNMVNGDKGRGVFKRWVVVLSIIIVVISTLATTYYIKTNSDNGLVISDVVEEKSIAVLPFKNWSGDPDLEYVSHSMTDAIITRLSAVESLKVIPFTSVMKYRSSDLDAPRIAKELGVKNILQGNFQLSGDLAKITLHLIHGPSNSNVSSKVYEVEWKLQELFNMQKSVVEDLARQLEIDVSSQEFRELQDFPTKNREAYDLAIYGTFLASQRTHEDWESAMPYFQQAIELDSAFIEAYLALAAQYLWRGAVWGSLDQKEAWEYAKNLLERAKKIDSTNTRLKQLYLDGLYAYEWDFDIIEKEYKNSSVAVPYLTQVGRFEEALAIQDRGIQRDPKRGFKYAWKAQILYFLNRKEEALELLKNSDELFSDHVDYLREAAKVCFYLGEYDRSRMYLVKIQSEFSDNPPIVVWLNAVNNIKAGNMIEANNYLNVLKSAYTAEASGSPAWFTALYYSIIGDYDNTFIWLERAFERHEVEMIWLREEPVLRPLRNDPRFIELYHKVGFPIPPNTTLKDDFL